MLGAIEAGGTKIVVAAGETWEDVRASEKLTLPTTTPEEVFPAIATWLHDTCGDESLSAIGVATFGPVDRASGTLSSTTPKVSWRDVCWPVELWRYFPRTAVCVETDVNAAALAEARRGAGKDHNLVTYLTVGTGIGGGFTSGGRVARGHRHPEMGHMLVPRVEGDLFPGVCDAHGACLEGLASGAALAARAGGPVTLAPSHPLWATEVAYLARGCANIRLTLDPSVLILGGGVMSAPGLRDAVAAQTSRLLGGYLGTDGDPVIVAPGLDPDSGILGAFLLAQQCQRSALVRPLASWWPKGGDRKFFFRWRRFDE